MRYRSEGRVDDFQMHGEKKATLRLPSGKRILVYMSSEYIVGEAEVAEALLQPTAGFIVYNVWDTVTQHAIAEATRAGVEIHGFGPFGKRLDELNDAR